MAIEIVAGIAVLGIVVVARVCISKVMVRESHVGLLYRNGRLTRELAPGGHFVWRFGTACEQHDLRRQSMTIAGQELLSKDNIGLKTTLVVRYEVANVRLAVSAVDSYTQELYIAAQLALRECLSRHSIDEVLQSRSIIGTEVLPLVVEAADAFGVKLHAVEMKDVMLPGDLKRAFAEVVRAREEGRAALEKARGESAALRNLANAAKLLDGNPALMNLRVLQSIAATAESSGNTLVFGVPQGLTELSRKN